MPIHDNSELGNVHHSQSKTTRSANGALCTLLHPPPPLKTFAAALSSFYHPVKVVPAHTVTFVTGPKTQGPGRGRSTALVTPVTSDAITRGRRELTEPRCTKVELLANHQTTMTYIEQFEAELVKKLQASVDDVTLVKWVCERVLESYKNGITAGEKGAKVIRKGESRRNFGSQAR